MSTESHGVKSCFQCGGSGKVHRSPVPHSSSVAFCVVARAARALSRKMPLPPKMQGRQIQR